jgi:hypothetical protein
MITQKINKYPEPPPYQMTTYSKPSYAPVTFTPKEINNAKELGIMCGITEGLCLEHTPTGHFITILGWVDDANITSHNGKPRIVKALRDRQGHQWETNYSVDELMLMEYKTVLEEIKP